MREEGFGVHIQDHRSWLRSHSAVRFARDILRAYRESQGFTRLYSSLKPDLVYINSLVGLAPALAARRMGIPTVWHVRELFSDRGGEMIAPTVPRRKMAGGLVDHLADEIVVVSEAVRTNVLNDRARRRSHVVPNAVSERFFNDVEDGAVFRQRHQLPIDEKLIGIPGTLRTVKGHSFLLDAFPDILREVPSARVAITGGGSDEYQSTLQDQADRLRVRDRLHFLGAVSNMPAFYHACDVVVIPSRSEPFGRTVIEAFACGVPVVASAVDGILEILRDNENGLLVPYGATDALAAAVVKMLTSSELRQRLCNRARSDAESRYHEDRYRKRIGEIAAGLLQKRRH